MIFAAILCFSLMLGLIVSVCKFLSHETSNANYSEWYFIGWVLSVLIAILIYRVGKLVEAVKMLDPEYKAAINAKKAEHERSERVAKIQAIRESKASTQALQMERDISQMIDPNLSPEQRAEFFGRIAPASSSELPEIDPQDIDSERFEINSKKNTTKTNQANQGSN